MFETSACLSLINYPELGRSTSTDVYAVVASTEQSDRFRAIKANAVCQVILLELYPRDVELTPPLIDNRKNSVISHFV